MLTHQEITTILLALIGLANGWILLKQRQNAAQNCAMEKNLDTIPVKRTVDGVVLSTVGDESVVIPPAAGK